ncbi:MAG TPA: bifunctional glutamate N-acetyltransferase/amino-acid acetyltransferase ArgJ [Candidatus Aquilonibacter sp.]|nr:bifunctional glutamate N-acetyltransferase/amino-acid acetyltransferase ArgJ [Candidatus Aquilonibacter sp.]
MNAYLSDAQVPRGFSFSAVHAGLKRAKLDLGLVLSETPASAAALFTTNQVVAAPVIVSREHLRQSKGRMRAVIVNSANANCCTEKDGRPAARETASSLAKQIGEIDPSEVVVCSTGVIGGEFRVDKILAAIPALVKSRASDAVTFTQFARAIMTTDTRPKWAAAKCSIGGKQVRVLGCAKGSGMIHPNMATMLSFVVTDAEISPALLDRALRAVAASTYNSITVDGDSSTNDTVAILANGQSGAPAIRNGGAGFKTFCAALEKVCASLAYAIVEDGEGAQRVIDVEVRGATSDEAAKQIGQTIATSPLVKTAFAGADPNWGRILAAAGRSGVKFDYGRVDIWLAGMLVCKRGREHKFSERAASRKMQSKHVPVVIDLGTGKGKARILTCDMTQEYVHINASYRT